MFLEAGLIGGIICFILILVLVSMGKNTATFYVAILFGVCAIIFGVALWKEPKEWQLGYEDPNKKQSALEEHNAEISDMFNEKY